MYCGERTNDRLIIKTMPVLGHWSGAAVGGFLSDSKGRRACMLLGLVTLSTSCLGIFVGASLGWLALVVLSEFMVGMAHQMITSNCLVLLTRFFHRKSYEFATVLWFMALYLSSHSAMVSALS